MKERDYLEEEIEWVLEERVIGGESGVDWRIDWWEIVEKRYLKSCYKKMRERIVMDV